MKLRPVFFFSLLCSSFLFAQNPAQKPLVFGNNNTTSVTKPTNFEEYLVQLAITNSPELEGAKYEIDARGEEIGIAGGAGLSGDPKGILPLIVHILVKRPATSATIPRRW